jgi:hypothetical protein
MRIKLKLKLSIFMSFKNIYEYFEIDNLPG